MGIGTWIRKTEEENKFTQMDKNMLANGKMEYDKG